MNYKRVGQCFLTVQNFRLPADSTAKDKPALFWSREIPVARIAEGKRCFMNPDVVIRTKRRHVPLMVTQ